ncbi:MBL fold metallo-hydrolase [Desulfurococcaceae archaeon MEX13E-LK6-19]|nr:MBL fold metallo-hydrolase [Desulfurococcaceae archaeon MEX13E-LK6-19]
MQKLSITKGLTNIVDITKRGAILLGKNFAVDGPEKRPVRVITHAHSDHLIGLEESLQYSSMVIATPATIELILELCRLNTTYRVLFKQKAVPLDYNQEININGEKLTLLYSNHILGSAQVLVETNGYRLGYTGDFRIKNTPVMKDLDILVIEATYGSPKTIREFKDEVEDYIVDAVLDGLSRDEPVRIYGYYGKLQEVMVLLRNKGIKEPFIMPPKIYRITKIAVKYGYEIDNFYNSNTREAMEIKRTGRYILFQHMMTASRRNLDKGVNIVLSGWEFDKPIKKIDRNTWLIAYSSHADFNELLEYVEKAQPKVLIVDNSRESYAYEFANEVSKRLKIPAIVLP